MAASYLRRGMDGPATFSLYVRDMPKQRGFLVSAGLDDCLRFLESFVFEEEELAYLERDRLRRSGDRGLPRRALRGGRVGRARGADRPRERADRGGHRADRAGAARRGGAAEPDDPPLDAHLEGGAVRDRGRGPDARRLRVPAGARRGGCPRGGTWERDRGFRCDVQRRGGARARPPRDGDDGALVHQRVRRRARGVPGVRGGSPEPHDVPRRHLRHDRRACRTRST